LRRGYRHVKHGFTSSIWNVIWVKLTRWSVNIADIDTGSYDLSVKNPNKKDEAALRDPQEILEEIKQLDEESAEILSVIGRLL
jgi:hypothetical protein